ncbi:MAG: phosphoenolpyruvate mutase [Nanoarchaeota archaeon]
MTLKHLISPEERRAKLKILLQSGLLIRGMEVHNALSALIVNDLKVKPSAGDSDRDRAFDFFWESSLTDSASKGHPDIEIVSFDSRLKTIQEILEVTDKPMIIDGDTGGDIHHFEYLIPRLERAGVSAIIIEDKVFPKRNSLEEGTNQDQEDPDKFSEKIRTGKKIQNSEDFMIIARIESLIAGKSVADALKRAEKYLSAGVDGIMIHSKSPNADEIFQFSEQYKFLCNKIGIHKPLVCVPTTYNSVHEAELEKRGFQIAIYGNHMLRAAYKAMENVGKLILENGRSLEAEPHLASVKEIFEKVGFLDIKEKDKILSNIPEVIILAAGENPELKNVIGEIPKALIDINGKTILEHQISTFKKVGLNNINVLIGYKKEKFSIPGVNYIVNEEYSKTGVLNTLMKAEEKIKKGFIYINSDLLLDERLLKELCERKEDTVIVVDNSYLYHKHEVDKKLDAVITKKGKQPSYQRLRDSEDFAVRLGKTIPKENMTHEFIGLAKFSKIGADNLIKLYKDAKLNHTGKFHEAESFERAADTDMIQELINRGLNVSVHETNGGWIEIHSEKDLEIAKDMLRI